MSNISTDLILSNTNETSPSPAALNAITRHLLVPTLAAGLHSYGYRTEPIQHGLFYSLVDGGRVGAVSLINNNRTRHWYRDEPWPLEWCWAVNGDTNQRRTRRRLKLSCTTLELAVLAIWLPSWIDACARGAKRPQYPVPMSDRWAVWPYACTAAAHRAQPPLRIPIARPVLTLIDGGSQLQDASK